MNKNEHEEMMALPAIGELFCPLCNNRQATDFTALYNHLPEWEVVVCNGCSFTFIPDFYRQQVSYEVYKDGATLTQMQKGNVWIKLQRQKLRVAFLQRYLKKGRLLDVGAGWGHFLLAAKGAGFNVRGVEPDGNSSGHAQNSLGLDVRNMSVMDLPDTEQYDVITMWDVLEHLDQPANFIDKCARLTTEGGYLLLQVPQIDSYVAKRQKEKWIHLSLDHVNYFSRKTITRLLEQKGYEVLEIRSSFELKFLLTHSLAARIKQKNARKKGLPVAKVFYEDRAATPAEGAALFNKFTKVPQWMLWCFVKMHNMVYKFMSAINVGEEMMLIARKK